MSKIEIFEKELASVNSEAAIRNLLQKVYEVPSSTLNSGRYQEFFTRAGAKLIELKNENLVPGIWFSSLSRQSRATVYNSEKKSLERAPIFSKIWKDYLGALSLGSRHLPKRTFKDKVKRMFSSEPVLTNRRYERVVRTLAELFRLQEAPLTRLVNDSPVNYLEVAKNEIDSLMVPYGYQPIATFGFRHDVGIIRHSTVCGLVYSKTAPFIEESEPSYGKVIIKFTDDSRIWGLKEGKPHKENNEEARKQFINAIIVAFLQQCENKNLHQ